MLPRSPRSPGAALRAPLALLAVLATCAACAGPMRPDDVHEPNDRPSEATFLEPGSAIRLRANEGDPDVFAVIASGGGSIVFVLESLGLEEAAGFRVEDPRGDVLFEDVVVDGRRETRTQIEGAGLELLLPEGRREHRTFRLTVPVRRSGRHLLTVLEGGRPGAHPFSWDYSIRVRLDP